MLIVGIEAVFVCFTNSELLVFLCKWLYPIAHKQ